MAALSRNRIIFVPGKNPKPLPAVHRALLWRSLLGGVRHADPALAATLSDAQDCFHLVAWNDLYYRQIKAVEDDLPWIDVLLEKSAADERDRREALNWRHRWARRLYVLADRFPFLIGWLPGAEARRTIHETDRYFSNHHGIGSQVRELLKADLRRMFAAGDRVMVIGHSMGSIIAYDALWELWHGEGNPGRIDLFLTLGSPLGMRYVRKRLVGGGEAPGRRFPGNIRRWQNAAAQGDLTALGYVFKRVFAGMLARGLTESIDDLRGDLFTYFRNQHGLNVHRSYGYLAHPLIGRWVADWWRAGG